MHLIGFIGSSSANPIALTPSDLLEMLENLPGLLYEDSFLNNPIQSDRNGEEFVTGNNENNKNNRRVMVIDLIVINPRDNKVYMLPNVEVRSLLKDVINAGLNQQIFTNNDIDVTRIKLGNI